MRRARTPAASYAASRPSSAAASPETTEVRGAVDRGDGQGAAVGARRRGAPRPRARSTEAMPPRPASAGSARLRSATTRAPSSRLNAPATTAAAISPCEWPTTAAGRTPNDSHTAASDTITAHNAGWTTSTRSNAASSRSASSNGTSMIRRERRGALVHPLREHRDIVEQLHAPYPSTATLPREDEDAGRSPS